MMSQNRSPTQVQDRRLQSGAQGTEEGGVDERSDGYFYRLNRDCETKTGYDEKGLVWISVSWQTSGLSRDKLRICMF